MNIHRMANGTCVRMCPESDTSVARMNWSRIRYRIRGALVRSYASPAISDHAFYIRMPFNSFARVCAERFTGDLRVCVCVCVNVRQCNCNSYNDSYQCASHRPSSPVWLLTIVIIMKRARAWAMERQNRPARNGESSSAHSNGLIQGCVAGK